MGTAVDREGYPHEVDGVCSVLTEPWTMAEYRISIRPLPAQFFSIETFMQWLGLLAVMHADGTYLRTLEDSLGRRLPHGMTFPKVIRLNYSVYQQLLAVIGMQFAPEHGGYREACAAIHDDYGNLYCPDWVSDLMEDTYKRLMWDLSPPPWGELVAKTSGHLTFCGDIVVVCVGAKTDRYAVGSVGPSFTPPRRTRLLEL